MNERYNYNTENESNCIVCSSFHTERIGGHTVRCENCGVIWCESCND